MKTIDIITVNWNSGTQLNECVESIQEAEFSNCILNKVVVVDNDSKDNSLGHIEDLNYEKLEIIKNKDNLGFGKACNIGAKNSQSDFILFLNPDAIVYEDTFKKLFEYIDHNDRRDVAVYGVQLVGDNGEVQRNCARVPSLSSFINRSLGLNKLNSKLFPSYTMQEWDHLNTREVDQVMGAFFMIKKDIFEKLNGFDERFFVYYEELELSKRIKDAGYKTVFVSEAQAYHKGGGTSEQVKAKRLFYNTRSRLIYGFKHFGFFKGLFLMIFTFIFEPLTRTAFSLIKGKYSEILENFKGFYMLYLDSFSIVKQGLKK
ncbi:glycosyl transferase [Candidatus Woesearchaeota archaeon]|nr:MAG: glycosyl transferase [Candidatus Woesearchaeota archaeon]